MIAGLVLLIAVVGIGVYVVSGRISGVVPPVSSDPWTRADSVTSALLGKEMPVQVFLPPQLGSCRERPVLFAFHGRGGDQTQWMGGQLGQGVGLDSIAHRLIDAGDIAPIAIVSAFIDDSYGVDSEPATDGYRHGPYESYIADELLPEIERRYDLGGDASSRVAVGLSMGGFTAVSLALRTQMFRRVSALSPAIFVNPPRDREWIYGSDGSRNPLVLVDSVPIDGMSFFIGRGQSDYDWISAATDQLAERIATRGGTVSTLVVPGGHEVATWRQLAEPMLRALIRPPEDGSSAC